MNQTEYKPSDRQELMSTSRVMKKRNGKHEEQQRESETNELKIPVNAIVKSIKDTLKLGESDSMKDNIDNKEKQSYSKDIVVIQYFPKK